MNKSSFYELSQNKISYYSFVIGVAKLARLIVDESEEKGEIVDQKPVSLAIEEVAKGDYSILEPSDIGKTIE